MLLWKKPPDLLNFWVPPAVALARTDQRILSTLPYASCRLDVSHPYFIVNLLFRGLSATDLLSTLIIFPFIGCYLSGIIENKDFQFLCLSLSIINLGFIYIVLCVSSLFLFWITSHCLYVPQPVKPFSSWRTFG